jgi:hypothetical protein
MEVDEWKRRYKKRIMERSDCTEKLAEMVLEAGELTEIMRDYENDPEGSADEELACWDS